MVVLHIVVALPAAVAAVVAILITAEPVVSKQVVSLVRLLR
jgi:hypothetical protein